jgi:hypothetical protein
MEECFVTIWFYVKTSDTPKKVGDVVCVVNFFQDDHPKGRYSWVVEEGKSESAGENWQIKSKFEGMKDTVVVALVYRSGDTVVLGEVDDDFVPNFMDPLLEKYGFDNVKCVFAASKR